MRGATASQALFLADTILEPNGHTDEVSLNLNKGHSLTGNRSYWLIGTRGHLLTGYYTYVSLATTVVVVVVVVVVEEVVVEHQNNYST